jgi:hypothetical protein
MIEVTRMRAMPYRNGSAAATKQRRSQDSLSTTVCNLDEPIIGNQH